MSGLVGGLQTVQDGKERGKEGVRAEEGKGEEEGERVRMRSKGGGWVLGG